MSENWVMEVKRDLVQVAQYNIPFQTCKDAKEQADYQDRPGINEKGFESRGILERYPDVDVHKSEEQGKSYCTQHDLGFQNREENAKITDLIEPEVVSE